VAGGPGAKYEASDTDSYYSDSEDEASLPKLVLNELEVGQALEACGGMRLLEAGVQVPLVHQLLKIIEHHRTVVLGPKKGRGGKRKVCHRRGKGRGEGEEKARGGQDGVLAKEKAAAVELVTRAAELLLELVQPAFVHNDMADKLAKACRDAIEEGFHPVVPFEMLTPEEQAAVKKKAKAKRRYSRAPPYLAGNGFVLLLECAHHARKNEFGKLCKKVLAQFEERDIKIYCEEAGLPFDLEDAFDSSASESDSEGDW
jgi:hypothetical protein